MLAKHVDDLLLPVYYISGLPEMVSGMKTMLGGSGVHEASIQAGTFTGFDLNIIGGVPVRRWRRFIPVAAAVLTVTVLVILHVGAAVSIFRNGLGGISGASLIWYLTIGIVLVLALLKIRYFAGRHLSGRDNVGNVFLGQGDHTKHRQDGPTGPL